MINYHEKSKLIAQALKDIKFGDVLIWADLAKSTDLAMNENEQEVVRRQIKKKGFVYEALIGHGIRISCRENAYSIVLTQKQRLSSSINKTAAFSNNIITSHGHEIPKSERDKIELTLAVTKLIQSETRKQLAGIK